MRTAFAPKLASTAAVGRAMAGLPVRATVLFSSTAALFGAPGQGNYAAANAALEAWAAERSLQGQHALAIRWGAWAAGDSKLRVLLLPKKHVFEVSSGLMSIAIRD